MQFAVHDKIISYTRTIERSIHLVFQTTLCIRIFHLQFISSSSLKIKYLKDIIKRKGHLKVIQIFSKIQLSPPSKIEQLLFYFHTWLFFCSKERTDTSSPHKEPERSVKSSYNVQLQIRETSFNLIIFCNRSLDCHEQH